MDSRSIATAAVFGALWGVVNFFVSPYIFRLTRLPFFCDVIGLVSLFSALWVSRSPGTGTLVGIAATVVTLALRPGAFYFLGFTVASAFLDALVSLVGYERFFSRPVLWFLAAGVASAALAGLIIGAFFMGFKSAAAVLTWSGLHAIGGALGALVSVAVVKGLGKRIPA